MSNDDVQTMREDIATLKKQMLSNSLHDLRLIARVDALEHVLIELAERLSLPREQMAKTVAEAVEEATFARLSKLEDVNPALAASVSALLKEEENPPDLKAG